MPQPPPANTADIWKARGQNSQPFGYEPDTFTNQATAAQTASNVDAMLAKPEVAKELTEKCCRNPCNTETLLSFCQQHAQEI